MIEKLDEVECCWTEYIKISNKTYWKINDIFPNVCLESDRKLPSDSVFRKDLVYWNLKDNING